MKKYYTDFTTASKSISAGGVSWQVTTKHSFMRKILVPDKRIILVTLLLLGIWGLMNVNAQVTTLSGWTNIYNGTSNPTGTFSLPAGANRLLVVAIATSTRTAGARTVSSIMYGGQTLTPVAGDLSTSSIQHTQLYYLNEAGLDAATSTTLSATITGGTTVLNTMSASVYDNVNQTTPSTDSRNYNSAATAGTTASFTPTALTVNANDQAVETLSTVATGTNNPVGVITAATNWTSSNQQTGNYNPGGSGSDLGVRNMVAYRSIPSSNTTDASSTTVGNSLRSMTGMSIKVMLTPLITLSSPNPAVGVGNIVQNTTNNVIYRFDNAVTASNAVMTGLTITTAGTYIATDITNLKAWYSADNTFSAATDVLLSTKTTSLGPGSQVFPSWTNQTINSGTTGYIFITTDVPCIATTGLTININAVTTANVSFLVGTKSGTTNAGGAQTITSATLANVTGNSASVGDAHADLTWTNPTGCYDEVMIVAKATSSVTGTPTGNGSGYTANLLYGSGTAFGGGFVVYKGSTSPQTVTGLTNGTIYYYKFFTRRGTNWSAGIETSATPIAQSLASDYYRSQATGNWSAVATWESSHDNTTWFDATLIPTNSANTITINSPHIVTVNAGVSIDQATIADGGKVIVNNVTLTIAAGAGTDFTVNGDLELTGNSGAITTTGTLEFGNTGTYIHNRNGGTIPSANTTYSAGSLLKVTGIVGTIATLPATISGSVEWNCPGQTVAGDIYTSVSGGTTYTIGGDLTVTNTNTGSIALFELSNHILNIGGNYLQTNGKIIVESTGTNDPQTITVTGNFSLSGGTFDFSSAAATGNTVTMNIKGNLNHTGGTITKTATNGSGTISFNGTSTQTIESTGQTGTIIVEVAPTGSGTVQVANGKTFTASSGTTLNVNNSSTATELTVNGMLTTAGAFAVAGTLINNSTVTTTGALSGAGSLTNAASGALNIGGACSITTLANVGIVTISGSGNITTALASFTNTGTINLNGLGTIAGITNNASGTINLASSGIITALNNATGTSTLNISAAPVPAITTLTATVSGNLVDYTGAAQTVKVTTYNNLTLSGSGVKTMANTGISVTGVLDIVNTTSKASLVNGANIAVNSLEFNGTPQIAGTWGSSISTAQHPDDLHFAVAVSGIITVGLLPTFTNLIASPAICEGDVTTTLSGTVSATGPVYPAIGETVIVTINGVPQNTTITTATGGFTINFNTASLTNSGSPYTITYAYPGNLVLGPASNASTSLTINSVPTLVTASASPNPVCEGATLILTGGATGATGWSWSGPDGFSSLLQSPTIPNMPTAGAGVYVLIASNGCGPATQASTTSVVVSPLPAAAGPITGITTVVEGSTSIPYTVGTIANASTYNWTHTGTGWTIAGSGTNITVNFAVGATDGQLHVNGVNGCGNGTDSYISITVTGSGSPCTSTTWTGAFDNNWSSPVNWSDCVPGVPTDVTIPVVAIYPVISSTAFCNNLIIASGASILDNGYLTITSGANVTVERAIQGGEWHLISSPVSGAVSGMFEGLYLQTHSEFDKNYTDITGLTDPLVTMKGYALYRTGDATSQFVGGLNTGIIGADNNLTRSGIDDPDPLIDEYGWNLVGNPYPSYIDWLSSGWTKTNVSNAIYIHVNSATWATFIAGTGANGGSQFIAPCQGFFVHVPDAGSPYPKYGSLKMTNSVRTNSSANFFKSTVPDLVRLQLSGNGYNDEAVVRFLSDAGAGFDGEYDALKLFGDVPEAAQLYTIGGNALSINTMPETNLVNVGMRGGVSGTYTIAATEINDLKYVTLEDTKTGIFSELAKNAYSFNFTAGENEMRFKLHFSALGIDTKVSTVANIYSYQQTVYVNLNENVKGDIYIYNIAGQLITSKLSASGMNEMKLSNTGNYIVKVISKESSLVRKVFIN